MTVAFVLANSAHGAVIVNRFDSNGAAGNTYGVGDQILETGDYDPAEVELLRKLVEARRTTYGDGVFAIDCGANIGIHTLEWAKTMRGWGNVLAIEAQERVFYALAGNIALQNAFNARALWAAVGKEEGFLDIPEPDYCTRSSFGSFELKHRAGTENIGQAIDYDKPTLRVRLMKLDSLALDRVDLIKLDLEGMEIEAIEGAAETIKRHKPLLVVEFIKSDRAGLEKLLTGFGYDLHQHGLNLIAVQ